MPLPAAIAAGSLALSAAGTGVSAYGQYQANQTAQDNHKLALMQYNDWKRDQAIINAYNRNQNELSNTMGYGEYAGNLKDNAQSTYGAYNASIGR